jgi:hypothetical protein
VLDGTWFKKAIAEWEARQPRKPEIVRPGNSMRASYYTEKILPIYRQAFNDLKAHSEQLRPKAPSHLRHSWLFQEDNDPSHGTKNKDSQPAIYKQCHDIECIFHPANSPDLNPIEGIWNVIKNRVKRYLWEIDDVATLKQALQNEWQQVTQDQIQARINEMPWRVGQVYEHPEKRVKSDLW